MFDFHMHSTVSFDGHDTPERMARAALDAGLKEICFTDHRDYASTPELTGTVFDQAAYRAAYDGLTLPGLTVRRGMEFGMQPGNEALLAKDAGAYPYDFILGSIHMVGKDDVYFPPYWAGKTVYQAERRYLEETLACVRTHDDFDVLAHLTYLSKARAHPTHAPVRYEDHREIVDAILSVLAQKGKGLEMNTSGVDRCGDFLPGAEFFRRFRELGGEIVTVGSDAHTAGRVGQYAGRACEVLKEIFGYVCTFTRRQPVFHKL